MDFALFFCPMLPYNNNNNLRPMLHISINAIPYTTIHLHTIIMFMYTSVHSMNATIIGIRASCQPVGVVSPVPPPTPPSFLYFFF